jgi:hypothetical protein
VGTLVPALDREFFSSLSAQELDMVIDLAEKGVLTLEPASD